MDNRELKAKIENKSLSLNKPLLLKYSDSPFICRQYAKAIGNFMDADIIKINALSEMDNSRGGLFDMFESRPSLYIYETEKLSEPVTENLSNLIVICSKIDADCEVDYVDIMKLQPWQIEDFVHYRVPGLPVEAVKWLCEAAKYDIYRLDSEAAKLEIFPENYQEIIFNQLNEDGGYCDLNPITIYNFTNAVIKKDLPLVAATLRDLKYIDIEGTGMVTVLKRNFRNIIDIQLNPRATAASLNMKPGQFWAVKQNVGIYTSEQLISIYKFLVDFDGRLKTGEFSFASENRLNNRKLVEYLTECILTMGES